jgi:hypothetical protein
MLHLLLQTTIPYTQDDWSIERFALLHQYLVSLTDSEGAPLCKVTSRNREVDQAGNDPVLSTLDTSEFDELWLFAVDTGDGLSDLDLAGINRFNQRLGGVLTTRDHMDLGCSLCELPRIGGAHFFNTHNPDPDVSRHCVDDPYTTNISWPNYHSGRNGDYQRVVPVWPIHPLMQNAHSNDGIVVFLPAHPHEGAVGIPEGETHAQIIAKGLSQTTGRTFNIAVAFDHAVDSEGYTLGRAVAQSTFHHFCDYNWNADAGCPSFVSEAPGHMMQTELQALRDTHAYIKNLVVWLAGA